MSGSTGDTEVVLDSVTVGSCTGAGIHLQQVSSGAAILLTISNVASTGNDTGFGIAGDFPEGLILLEYCEASYNDYGFYVVSPVIVNWSSIHDNVTYDVYVQTPVTSCPSLDFRYND